MKKILRSALLLIMAFAVVFALFGCTANNDTDDENTPEDNNGAEIDVADDNEIDVPDVLPIEEEEEEEEEEVEDAIIMFVSNLQPSLPTPVFSKKVQIDWIIAGAGGDDAGRVDGETGEHLPPHESVTGTFSYQFVSEDGRFSGRVVGEDGVISVYALRDNGTYVLIDDEINLEQVPDAEEIYEFATIFTEHFATITRTDHTHTFPPNLGVKSTEDFPIYEGSDRIMTFYYEGDYDGGMMMAMEFEGAIKYVSNLQPDSPTPIFAKKTQIDWIIAGAGGDDAGRVDRDTGEHLPPHDSVNGVFSYQFASEDGELRGRVEGVLGEIRVFARRDNGTYALIDFESNLGQAPNAEEIYNFATKFTEHFATITRTDHTHTFPPDLGVKSTEDFPIYEGSDRIMTFYYDGDNDGGMMMAMEFEGVIKYVSNLQRSLPNLSAPNIAQVDWIIAGAGGDDENRVNSSGEHIPPHSSVTGVFSFHFSNEDGDLQGRVVGENGEIMIFALRNNGTYVLIDDDINLEQVPNAMEIYEFASKFTAHFATSIRLPEFVDKSSISFLLWHEGPDTTMTFHYDTDNDGMIMAIELQ